MGSSAVIIVFYNIKLYIVVKECAFDWPKVKEEVESEVAKEEGNIVATTNKSMESLTRD